MGMAPEREPWPGNSNFIRSWQIKKPHVPLSLGPTKKIAVSPKKNCSEVK